MAGRTGFFYGWVIVVVTWILYGFGIAPAFYSWGQFAPALIDEFDLSKAEFGLIFGFFTFTYSAVGPLVAFLQSRISIRITMTFGAALSAAGFWYMSRADSILDCYIGFVLMGGVGIGMSTILPSQTLGQNWFFKYRARSIAIMLTAGGIIGAAVPLVDKWFLDNRSWNDGWLLIAGISAAMAVVAFVFVRDRPEVVGQFRDGADEDPEKSTPDPASIEASSAVWTASQAIRTRQFAMMILCGLAYAIPWGIVVAHGRLHMDDIGLSSGLIAGLFAWMILISIFGRLSASLGDLVRPQMVLAGALILEAIGVAGLLVMKGPALGYVCVTLIGLGFGAGYISISVVFAEFFGRRAFAGTTGTRFLIGGTVGLGAPWLAGVIADKLGSYNLAFAGLAVLCLAGAVSALFCPAPGAPPDAEGEAS